MPSTEGKFLPLTSIPGWAAITTTQDATQEGWGQPHLPRMPQVLGPGSGRASSPRETAALTAPVPVAVTLPAALRGHSYISLTDKETEAADKPSLFAGGRDLGTAEALSSSEELSRPA